MRPSFYQKRKRGIGNDYILRSYVLIILRWMSRISYIKTSRDGRSRCCVYGNYASGVRYAWYRKLS